MKTTVVHFKYEPYDVLITRGHSIFGNPFRIGEDGNRSEVIQKYIDWAETPEEVIIEKDGIKYSNKVVRENVHTLKGLRLGCWCKHPKQPKPCHGDYLAKLADASDFIDL